jgi:hypothetical protein
MAGSSTDALAHRRAVETWTAAALILAGGIVAAESLTHDIGWNETGPGPGYFPFRVGLLLVAVAAVLLRQRRGGARAAVAPDAQASSDVFVTRTEWRRTLSVFWPTAALVAAMPVFGAYVPSAVYLAWMMRRHGGHGWGTSAAFGAAAMAVFFLVFELWFRVPLAKGPVEAALGIY